MGQTQRLNYERIRYALFFAVQNDELKIIDFKYTGYDNVPPDSIDDWAKGHEQIDRDIAKRMMLDTIYSGVAIEGGAFETDGKDLVLNATNAPAHQFFDSSQVVDSDKTVGQRQHIQPVPISFSARCDLKTIGP